MEQYSIVLQETSIPMVVARPKDKVLGAVLIIPSIFGSDQGTLDLASTLADHHILAVVPTLFFRGDHGPCGFDEHGKTRALTRMKTYQQEQGIADLQSVIEWMRAELVTVEGAQILAHGICFGGHLAALLALRDSIDALSTVHGGRLDQVCTQGDMTVPAFLHFGDADPAIPIAKVDVVRTHWPKAKVMIHPQAGHGFAHPGSPMFMESAYQSSLADLLNFFS